MQRRGASTPLLPALLEARYPGFGALVLHLPVTAEAARDAGRAVWGYTKFLAAMRFERTPEQQKCRVDEGGRHLLTLRVARRGHVARDRRPLVTYSVRAGELIKTVIPHRALLQTRFGGRGRRLRSGRPRRLRQLAPVLLGARHVPRPVLHRHAVSQHAAVVAAQRRRAHPASR